MTQLIMVNRGSRLGRPNPSMADQNGSWLNMADTAWVQYWLVMLDASQWSVLG